VPKATLEAKFPWAKTASSATAKVPHRVPFPLVRRLHQICATAVADSLAYDDLSPQQYSALACVDDFPGIDQRRLAAMMGVDRTNVGMILDQVETKGFVERKINGADRRARELFVTRSGHSKRQQVRPQLLAAQARVLAPLNDGERDQLIELLVRLIEANEVVARPGAGRRPPRKAKVPNGGLDAPTSTTPTARQRPRRAGPAG
jgi:DNA-binding MarR family transcriptional regulator